MATTDHIEQAQQLLSAGNEEGALVALLEAWRDNRNARVADLVELLSARVSRGRDPIRGKTVKARTAQWKAISAKRDPADVQRLLDMLWPPRWQAALELLKPLSEWPDDPRIAAALLRCLSEDRYNTWTSYQFYQPLIRLLERMGDPRALEPMKAWADQQHPHYISGHVADVRAVIAAIDKRAGQLPALSRSDEARCSALAQLLGAGAQAKAEQQREALLSAVFDNPRDLARRQVLADFLSEQGDPLGEFINLQLAPRRDAKSRRREAALLKAHRREWLGSLAKRVEVKSAIFRGGYPTEVTLKGLPRNRLPEDLSSAAWSTVRVLTVQRIWGGADLPAAFFELPWVQALEGIYNLSGKYLTRIEKEGPLTELGIVGDVMSDEVQAALKKAPFPKLGVLGLESLTPESLEQLSELALLKRVAQLRIVPDDNAQLGALIKKLQRLPSSLQEVWLLRQHGFDLHEPAGWYNIFQRDDEGKLAKMALVWGGGTFRLWQMALDLVPKSAVSSVEVRLPKRKWSQKERQHIEEACAHLRPLAIELPWSDAPPQKPRLAPRGPRVSLSLDSERAIDKDQLVWILSWLQDKRSLLRYTYDSFRVNSGIHRVLGSDPLARISKWIKPSTHWIELYCDGQEDLRNITFSLWSSSTRHIRLNTDGFSEQGFASRYLDCVMELLEHLPVTNGSVEFAEEHQLTSAERDQMPSPLSGLSYHAPTLLEWANVFGEKTRALISTEDLDRAARPAGGQVLVRHGRRSSVVVFGESPLKRQLDVLQSDAVVAFHREIQRRLRKSFAAKVNYDFVERVGALIGPAAEAIGLEPWPDEQGALPTLRFGARNEERRFWVHLQLFNLLEQPALSAGMHDQQWSWRPFDTGQRHTWTFPADTRQNLETSLQAIASQFPTAAAEYMRECLSGNG